ncbi:DUF2117 domain-containing protein [Desulfobacter curvatus]|uniref:DUF2117 domain-containing protein n=1 Tax=Desulfobacter curvatus TaxID=2290 RepID=UPI0003763F7B|nr:DUF2117 domain-containing protein [Desulfobacter curvatus]
MIGLLFHGPEVFDSGWAQRVINVLEPLGTVRCVLAGTMGRTAVFDSGLNGIEFWDQMPGACLKELSQATDMVIIVNYGKSVESGLVFGGMVVDRARVNTPVVQVECAGPFGVEWQSGCSSFIIDTLTRLGLSQREKIELEPSVWSENGKIYRRMTTAEPGDFVLVNGIMVGLALGTEVVMACQNGHLCDIKGVDVKTHGIEKLDRLGGVDLKSAKLASTPTIRRTCLSRRMVKSNGRGMVFIDHAGMHVYQLANEASGVVTVGDDTTVVAADILSRFDIPVIGIVDGDEDVVLKNGSFASGSVRLTVRKDDEFGLKVQNAVFGGEKQSDISFTDALNKILSLAGNDLVGTQYF